MSASSQGAVQPQPRRRVVKRGKRKTAVDRVAQADQTVEDSLAKFAGVFQIPTPKFLLRDAYIRFVLVATLGFYFSLDMLNAIFFLEGALFSGKLNAFRQLAILSLFALALPYVLIARKNLRTILKSQIPLIMLLSFCALSVLWTLSPGSTQVRVIALFIQVFTFLAIYAARPSKAFFFDCLCLASAPILIFNLLSFFVELNPFVLFKEAGYYGYFTNKNTFGIFSMVSAGIWTCALLHYKTQRMRALSLAMVLIAAYYLYISDSKTALAVALIALPPALLLAFSVKSGQRPTFYTLLVSMLVLIGFGFVLTWIGLDPITEEVYGDTTFTGRTEIWGQLWRVIQQDPWLGVGFRAFWDAGANSPHLALPDPVNFLNQGHNGYIDVILTLGFIGLGLLMLYLLQPFFALVRIARYYGGPAHSTPLLAVFLYFPLCAMLHNITESSYLTIDTTIFATVVFSTMVVSSINRKFDRLVVEAPPKKPAQAAPGPVADRQRSPGTPSPKPGMMAHQPGRRP
ncbi:MAG: O-antigen ligase family protein [Geminicoccaceae bacterium]